MNAIDLKIALKYKLKVSAIKLLLMKLDIIEIDSLIKCVSEGVSFWVTALREGNEQLEDEQEKNRRIQKIDNFGRYLTINVLYDLIVKKKEYSYMCTNDVPLDGLFECVYDSDVATAHFPFITDMRIYRDKVMLNDSVCYDFKQSKKLYNKFEF